MNLRTWLINNLIVLGVSLALTCLAGLAGWVLHAAGDLTGVQFTRGILVVGAIVATGSLILQVILLSWQTIAAPFDIILHSAHVSPKGDDHATEPHSV